MNGVVETINKNLKKIIHKMIVTYKDWHEILLYAFHAYQTIIRTSTGATLYSLEYEMKTVMPLEVEISSLRILINVKLKESEWEKLKFKQFNIINEKRLAEIYHHLLYQSRIANAYNKRVEPRVFKETDLIFKKIFPILEKEYNKWALNYEGSYVVKAFSRGTLILTKMDGDDLPKTVNFNVVKKYHA